VKKKKKLGKKLFRLGQKKLEEKIGKKLLRLGQNK